VITQNKNLTRRIHLSDISPIYRIEAATLALLALASSITFTGQTSSHRTASQSGNHGNISTILNANQNARLRDDTPTTEKGETPQVFVVQPGNEAVLEFANADDLERLTR